MENVIKFEASLPGLKQWHTHLMKIFGGIVKGILIIILIWFVILTLIYIGSGIEVAHSHGWDFELTEFLEGMWSDKNTFIIYLSSFAIYPMLLLCLPLWYFSETGFYFQCRSIEVDEKKHKFTLHSKAGDIKFDTEDIVDWGIDSRTNLVLGLRLKERTKEYATAPLKGQVRKTCFIPLWYFDAELSEYLQQKQGILYLPEPKQTKDNGEYYEFFHDRMRLTFSDYSA
jgi:hypothetical protein